MRERGGSGAKKIASKFTWENESRANLTSQRANHAESDTGSYRANLQDGLQTAQGGEFDPGSLAQSGRS